MDLLTTGTDTPGIRILAGLLPPFDQIETTRLLDRTLRELGIPPVDKAAAVEAYAIELVESVLHDSQAMTGGLRELADLCIDTGYPKDLMPFYLLHFARSDLAAHDIQHYWDGADRTNIDEIVRHEAQRWLADHKRAA